jgi:hypothetical protein
MLQRTCDCGQHTGGGECEECKKKKRMPLQRLANGSSAPGIAPPIVHDVLHSAGQPLEEDAQSYFAPRFGHDFSHVRVHSDDQAAESARAVGALAYTVGNHVVFGAGRYSPEDRSGKRLLAHELTHVVQQQDGSVPSPQARLEVGPSQDRHEREAEQFADRIVSGSEASQKAEPILSPGHLSPSRLAPRLQRAEAAESPATAAGTTRAASAPAAASLLVEDDALDTKPGQMKKGEFLDKLQTSVCATADEVLSSVGRTAKGCPYIERWIGHLRTKGSQFVERGIRKYAPDSAGVTKAEDYIPFVAARVRRGVTRWAKTGEITEVPDELKGQLMGANILAGADRLLSGIGGAIGGAVSAIAGGVKKAASAIGGVFAKERDGGVRDAGDPREIQAQLRSGHPLDAGVKSRMESAFGGDFSSVRVHTDSTAAGLSTRLNARAFTVGRDVAFGAGEYRPGTLIGDALIAHELAHVVQQGSGAGPVAPMSRGTTEYNALEEDADVSAVGAVVSLLGGAKGKLRELGSKAMPRLRSGLRLSRCDLFKTEKDAGVKDAGTVKDAAAADATAADAKAADAKAADAGAADAGSQPVQVGKVTEGSAWDKCGRKSTKRTKGFTGDTTGTHISAIDVTINANAASKVALTWANASLAGADAGAPPSSFEASPGAGLCITDCSDKANSAVNGSHCTEIGSFQVQGYSCHLREYPTAKFVTWFNYKREIAFHYFDVPSFPASHGCVRLPPATGGAEWIYDNTLPSVTSVTVNRNASGGPGPKCWSGGVLVNRPTKKKAPEK